MSKIKGIFFFLVLLFFIYLGNRVHTLSKQLEIRAEQLEIQTTNTLFYSNCLYSAIILIEYEKLIIQELEEKKTRKRGFDVSL